MNRIILTTLPFGRVRDAAGRWYYRWNVLASLRLDATRAGARLADYPAFLDWPAMIRAAEFALEYKADEAADVDVVALERKPAPDSALWSKLFRPDLPVAPYETPDAGREPAVRSFDGGALAAELREVYAASLLTSGRTASVRPLLGKFVSGPDESATVTLRSLVGDAWPETAAAQFRRYHAPTDADPPDDGDEAAPTDFHRAQSIVVDYPGLARAIGIVLAFQIEASAVSLPAVGLIRTRMQPADASDATVALPWTAYETAGPATERLATFHPRPADADDRHAQSRAGFVSVDDDSVALVQEPLGGAVLSLAAYAADAARESESAGEQAAMALPPALPGSGIGLFDRRCRPALSNSLARRPALESWLAGTSRDAADGADPVLYAEDLTAGHRVDVRVEGGAWRSLCERSVSFRIAGDDAQWNELDEGYLAPVGNLQSKGELSVLKTTDALFDWQGWSLVVSPPGKAEADEGGAVSDVQPDDPDFPLIADIAVRPGSLEPQRFGRRYSFRCRSTDLAGQSWSREEADALTAAGARAVSEPAPYPRYEPIAAPSITPATAPGLGETAAVIAIGNAALAGGRRKTAAAIHILPPRATVQLAERHGVFDAMSAEDSWHHISAHQGSVPADYDPERLRKLAVRGGDRIRVPYLADPLAHGIVLIGLPGADGPVGPIAYPRQGPEVESILLKLAPSEAPQTPRIARGGEITVYLTPGTEASIGIASVPFAGDVDLLAYAGLLSGRAHGGSQPPPLPARLERGEAPLVAPALELRLVHAVQRPVSPPRFGSPTLTREPGGVTAVFEDATFTVHGPSTARVDVHASWQDRLDAGRRWQFRPGRAQAFHADIGTGKAAPLAGADTRHDYPDTRFRNASYFAVATSRYADFYADPDPAAYTVTSEPADLAVQNTAPPAPPEVAYIVPTFRWDVEEDRDGVVRRRSGGGLRIFLRRPWFSSGENEQLAVIFAARTKEDVPDWIARRVTRWGFNPVKPATPLPPFPSLEDVSDHDHTTLAWNAPPNWLGDDTPAETKHSFNMACYTPTEIPGEELMFCDIELDPGAGYLPMARLALARYQPGSVHGAEFSAMVRADAVQLMPARSLTLRQTKRQIDLRLEGVGYPQESAPGQPGTTVVEARFETRDRAIPDEDLGWKPASEPVRLDLESLPDQRLRWRAVMTLPEGRAAPLRLVVIERECCDTDAGGGPSGWGEGRLVYLDTVELGR